MARIKEIALQFTRRIPLVEKQCPACGTTFEGPAQRVYCSMKCRKQTEWARGGKQWNANRKARKEKTE